MPCFGSSASRHSTCAATWPGVSAQRAEEILCRRIHLLAEGPILSFPGVGGRRAFARRHVSPRIRSAQSGWPCALVAACTQYALFCTSDFPAISFLFAPYKFRSPPKSLLVIYLGCRVRRITGLSGFGAASASVRGNKEAANSSMTYTLFDSPRYHPNRSGWRNGNLHRLS